MGGSEAGIDALSILALHAFMGGLRNVPILRRSDDSKDDVVLLLK